MTVDNWFLDAAHSQPAGRLPQDGDTINIVVGSTLFTDTAPALSLAAYSGAAPATGETGNLNIAADGTLTLTAGNWWGTCDALATVTFSGSSVNSGTILGNATFNDSSINASTISGDATFNDSSVNSGTVNGTTTYNYTPTTLHFYNDGVNDLHWATIGNWWKDASHTIPAGRAPIDGDTVRIEAGNTFDDQAPAQNLAGLFGDLPNAWNMETANLVISAGGSLTITSGVWFGSTDATATVAFSGTGSNGGTIGGDATFNDSSKNSSAVMGDAVFNGSSSSEGTVMGDATFAYASGHTVVLSGSMMWGVVRGAALGQDGLSIQHWSFSGSSANVTTISGDPTFTGSSANLGTVTGDASFSDSSNNSNWGTVTGDATFSDQSSNSGTVSGDAIFASASAQTITLSGNMSWAGTYNGAILDQNRLPVLNWVFNDSSINYGTVPGAATFNDSSFSMGTVTGNATFNGTSSNNGGFVTGNAFFFDDSYNSYGTITGNATFSGASYNSNGTIHGTCTDSSSYSGGAGC